MGCVRLGLWQWHRHEWRSAESARIERSYDAPPAAIEDVVRNWSAGLPPDLAWRQVTLQGTYTGETILVRGRTERSVLGYEVLAPFQTSAGTIVVNRGHVAQPRDGVSRPAVPPPPGGALTVTGWLRPSEAVRQNPLPDRQLASVALGQVSEVLGRDVAGMYVRMRHEDPSPADRPTPLAAPDTGQGPHLAYAIQWWLGALALPAMFLALAARQARDEQLARDGGRAVDAAGASPPPRRWVWDDEDELV